MFNKKAPNWFLFFTLVIEGGALMAVELIGANRGFSVVKDLKKLGYQVNEVNTNEQSLQMLLRQRIQT